VSARRNAEQTFFFAQLAVALRPVLIQFLCKWASLPPNCTLTLNFFIHQQFTTVMKRTWLLLALLVLSGVGAYYALKKNKKAQIGSAVAWDMDFAVKDTSTVHKIFLADRTGKTILLERKLAGWICNDSIPVRETAMQIILETIGKVKVYFIPAEAAEPDMIKSIAAEGIKVEVYGKDNKPLKVYYVGGVTPDETGTYMMMEGAERPYVTHIASMIGGLRVRFMMNEDDWRSRTIFQERPEQIQSISVQYPQQKSESFILEKSGEAQYSIRPFYSTTTASKTLQRKGVAEAYLLGFEKLGAEGHETEYVLRDSFSALVPFAIVTVKKTDGTEKQVKFWPSEVQELRDTKKTIFVRYLAQCSWGPFVLVQHHVFGKIFRGYSYFFSGKDATISG
jgi:hypothetical protein